MGEFAIGQGVPRFEDPRLVRGGGHYIDDVVYPGMAFGVVLRSPHAHARIKSIDVSATKASPGVLAVITAADWNDSGFGDLPSHPGLKRRGGADKICSIRYCLCSFPHSIALHPSPHKVNRYGLYGSDGHRSRSGRNVMVFVSPLKFPQVT